ncbi:MAG: DUF58 domain-containing protein [Phycisphaerae bacterium]|jgi:uncharacterized protein (DUF58 family)|nr:DUF58 domain-containing protein [Phycisphaerae bacterium]
MIAPRSILIWITGLLLVPAALISAADPTMVVVLLGAATLIAVVAVGDAVAVGDRLAGVEIQAPAITRLSKGVEGQFALQVFNRTDRALHIRVAIPTDRHVGCAERDRWVDLPAESGISVEFTCLPTVRGKYDLQQCCVAMASPLGLWIKRNTLPCQSEIRVHPDLMSERKRISAVFLNRGGAGAHIQRQVGRGREFDNLREYVAGDGYDEIHWKATAKRARPITKVLRIERTQEVNVIIDASRLSARVPDAPNRTAADIDDPAVSTMLERFVTAAMILGMAADKQGDRFGVMSFSDRVDNFVRARTGRSHYRSCRDAMYALQPRMVAPDFSELFAFIRMRLRRRALLVFLTCLDDPIVAENFAHCLPLIAKQHLVVVNMIRPWGVGELFSGEKVSSVDDVYSRLGGHLRLQQLEELQKGLQHSGARFNLVDNESLCPRLVSQYINLKHRQLL